MLCKSPIDALRKAAIEIQAQSGMPLEKTMYMAVDSTRNLPVEFLRTIPKVITSVDADIAGFETAREIQELLPHAQRMQPKVKDWNSELLERLRQKQKQLSAARIRAISPQLTAWALLSRERSQLLRILPPLIDSCGLFSTSSLREPSKITRFYACNQQKCPYVVLNIFLKQQQKCPDSLKASLFNYKFGQFNNVSDIRAA